MIAVHSGAGSHNKLKHAKYKSVCKKACRAGMEVIKSGGSALEAVTAAIKGLLFAFQTVLEDDPLTNSGYGSNLTTQGIVECDAAVMDGSNLLYGGCGCTTNIKNPIELACDICIRQTQPLQHGLIPPSLLVGDGARLHAERYGIKTINNKELVTQRALRKLNSCADILNNIDNTAKTETKVQHMCDTNNRTESAEEREGIVVPMIEVLDSDLRMDTVGAVCCDLRGHVASGCSSGGLLLKRPGRVGQGAIYASGVWADSFDEGEISVAATTSGCGEYLARTHLAKEICEDLKKSVFPTPDLWSCIKSKFLNSRFLKSAIDKNAGALVIHVLPSGEGTALWGHSTRSMSIGFMSVDDTKPKTDISYLSPGLQAGESIMVGGSIFKLNIIPSNVGGAT